MRWASRTYAEILRLHGCVVRTAATAAAALEEADAGPLAAVITDFHLPDVDGAELLKRLRERPHHRLTPVAIVTGDYFLSEAVSCQIRQGRAMVRFKPLWLEDIVALVAVLLTSEDRADEGTT